MSRAIFPILLQIGLVLPVFGHPYYIAPTGSDGNPGTLEKPFAVSRMHKIRFNVLSNENAAAQPW